MKIHYREYQVSESLKPYVYCYWSVTPACCIVDWSDIQRCFPAGLVELITHVRSDLSIGFHNDNWSPYPESFITGMYDKAAMWKLPANGELFGIRFTPEGAMRLFGNPVHEFFNAYMDAETYGGTPIRNLCNRMIEAETIPQRLFWVEKTLYEMVKSRPLDESYFSKALQMIRSDHFSHVGELSRALEVCERQIQRTFKESLGLGPKTYYRLMRLYKAHNRGMLHRNNLGNLAIDLGYTDQAHFTRDFKTYFGMSPANYFANLNMEVHQLI